MQPSQRDTIRLLEDELKALRRAHAAEMGAVRHELATVRARNIKLEKMVIGLKGRTGVRDAERDALKVRNE
jgi:hypothetical protein